MDTKNRLCYAKSYIESNREFACILNTKYFRFWLEKAHRSAEMQKMGAIWR